MDGKLSSNNTLKNEAKPKLELIAMASFCLQHESPNLATNHRQTLFH